MRPMNDQEKPSSEGADPAPADSGIAVQHPPKKAKPATDRIEQRSAARDAAAAAVAASLPADQAGLLDVAKECVQLYNDAVMNRADFAALIIGERHDAIVWKLNGGTYFGCHAGDESAGPVVSRHCQAVPGEVPLWGQQGEFMITVTDIRCWVKCGGGLGSVLRSQFEFNVVDLDAPFISETGYRCHFCGPVRGKTVVTAATEIFAEFLSKQRRYLEPDYQDLKAQGELPEWIKNLSIPPRRPLAVREIEALPVPDGFELVDVVLTLRQAFIARKWAEAARPKIKAATRESKQLPATSVVVDVPDNRSAVQSGQRGGNVVPDPEPPKPGQRWKIVSVHHPCFEKDIGKIIVITKTSHENRNVFAHDDRPVTYRKNRDGRMVVNYDPRCVETVYGWDSLEIVQLPDAENG